MSTLAKFNLAPVRRVRFTLSVGGRTLTLANSSPTLQMQIARVARGPKGDKGDPGTVADIGSLMAQMAAYG